MQYLARLLSERMVVRTRDLHAAGFDNRAIAAATASGALVRPALGASGVIPGVYAHPDAETDPDLDDALACLMTGGVIGGQYAAMRHYLSTALPETMDLYVPHDRTLPRRPSYRLVRTRREETMTVGVETRNTALGVPIRMTGKARTVVDLVRARNRNGDDYRIGMESLVTYLDEGGSPSELMEVASAFEAWVPDAVEMLSNAHAEGKARGHGA